VASRLAKHLGRAGEEFCRQNGCRVVQGIVVAAKSDLVASYQRFGYRIVGEVPYDGFEVFAQPFNVFLLEKALFVDDRLGESALAFALGTSGLVPTAESG
jgi:hypothetical protein